MDALREVERRFNEKEERFKKLEGGDRVAKHVKCHTKAKVGPIETPLPLARQKMGQLFLPLHLSPASGGRV